MILPVNGLPDDAGEAALDFTLDHFFEFWVLEFFDGLVDEAEGDELAGHLVADAAGFEVEELLVGDRTRGGAVAALYLVGVDLEAWHGVGLALIAEQEVAASLVGIGEVGVLADHD